MNSNEKKLETKLNDIFDKLDKSKSLQEIYDLYLQAENLCNSNEEATASVMQIMSSIFFYTYQKSKDYFQQKGENNLTDWELNLLEKIVDLFQENAPKFKGSELPPNVAAKYKDFDDFVSWVEEDTNEAKSLILEIKADRAKKGDSVQSVDNQQIQKLQAEINSLTSQLAELQKQIGELLELLKKNQNSADQPAEQEIIQNKLGKIQNKHQQLQKQLEVKKQIKQSFEKQQEVQELKENKANSPQSSSQQPNNEFNWLYIAIPGSILLGVVGIIIAYLLGKKNKKE